MSLLNTLAAISKGRIRPTQGPLYLWGESGNYGTFANNTTLTSRSSPTQLGTYSWKSVIKNPHQGIDTATYAAIRSDSTLWVWGDNTYGQLGDNTTTHRSSPIQVTGSWTSVAMGYRHMVAIAANNNLFAWGDNSGYQLGKTLPAPILSWTWITQAKGGFYTAWGIKTDGTLWGWGYGQGGQIGDNATIDRSQPVQLKSTDGGYALSWVAIQSLPSGVVALAVRADNPGSAYVYGWGYCFTYEYGTAASLYTTLRSPVMCHTTTARPSQNSIFTGSSGTVGIINNSNQLWMWGNNASYQCANTGGSSFASPVQVDGSWMTIGIASNKTYGIKVDGSIWSWGNNYCAGFTSYTAPPPPPPPPSPSPSPAPAPAPAPAPPPGGGGAGTYSYPNPHDFYGLFSGSFLAVEFSTQSVRDAFVTQITGHTGTLNLSGPNAASGGSFDTAVWAFNTNPISTGSFPNGSSPTGTTYYALPGGTFTSSSSGTGSSTMTMTVTITG